MPRYSLRTLLFLLAIGPPMLAALWLNWEGALYVAVLCAMLLPFVLDGMTAWKR